MTEVWFLTLHLHSTAHHTALYVQLRLVSITADVYMLGLCGARASTAQDADLQSDVMRAAQCIPNTPLPVSHYSWNAAGTCQHISQVRACAQSTQICTLARIRDVLLVFCTCQVIARVLHAVACIRYHHCVLNHNR